MAEGQSMTVADVVDGVLAGEGGDFVREAVRLIAQELMEAEISAEIGAARGEVSAERLTDRNGYRPRAWETRVGELELLVPRKRSGAAYFPSFLEPRRRSEQAIVAVVLEAYVNGVSTRKVDRLVEQLGIQGMSKDRVSALCWQLDEQVEAFRQRPLEGDYPYLWLDASRSRCAPTATCARRPSRSPTRHETGVREVLGLDIGEVESGAFWVEFLRSLRSRGLQGVRLCVSEDHEGLKQAIARVLACPGSAARSTSSATCSSTAGPPSAGSSPPPCARSSTPRAATRPASGSARCSDVSAKTSPRSPSCSSTPRRT
jgi:putative transposase